METPSPDWERLRLDYENTSSSLEELARNYRVSEPAIIFRAGRHGWTRKCTALAIPTRGPLRQDLDRVSAAMQAGILAIHRKDLHVVRDISSRLLFALSRDMVELPNVHEQARTFKLLTDSVKTTIQLERQAYGIETVPQEVEAPLLPTHEEEDALFTKFQHILNGGKFMGDVVEVPKDERT